MYVFFCSRTYLRNLSKRPLLKTWYIQSCPLCPTCTREFLSPIITQIRDRIKRRLRVFVLHRDTFHLITRAYHNMYLRGDLIKSHKEISFMRCSPSTSPKLMFKGATFFRRLILKQKIQIYLD